MKSPAILERLAVCTWSLQPLDPEDLVQKVRATGLHRVQLALDPLREFPAVWGQTQAILQASGITAVAGMVGCIGEDYSTLESIRRTGGLAPDTTWAANLAHFQTSAALARQLGLKLVTFHAGFLPPHQADPAYDKMLQRLRQVAEVFGEHHIRLGLETGQESATELAGVLSQLNHANIGVNFDPANMILYDKGDPVQALQVLAPWIRQIHVKDANRTQVSGTWGEEVPVGAGQVDWRGFFSTVRRLELNVNLAIERESGHQRVADIQAARAVVEQNFI